MKLSKAVVSGLCAWGMSLPALAQAPATTITIGELPALGGDRINRLASVTITENNPAAIRDGTFTLYFPDNPDQTVEFQSSSTVSGPATARAATNFLIITVDTDDTVTETLVIQPEAYYRTRLPIAPGFALQDGDPMRMNRSGVLDGVVMDRFELGTMGDIIGLEIGFEEDVLVGETIIQPIRTAEGGSSGPYTAETLDPAIASAVADGDTVRITGLTPGTTHALVHDSLGREDIMVVNVLPPAGGDLTGTAEPEPEPEPEQEVQVAVTPRPQQDATAVPALDEGEGEAPAPGGQDSASEPEPELVAGSTSEPEPAAPEPAPQPQPEQLAGSAGNNPIPAIQAPMPEATDTGSQGGAQAAAPVDLPRLADPAVMGGGTSTAVITAGATADGASFRNSFSSGERVSIEGEILPEVAQVNQQGELFVVVHMTTASGSQAWFHKNGATWERWNGRLSGLQPAQSGALAGSERLQIFEGALRPGRYKVYLGYMAQGDTLIYSGEPLTIEVGE